MQHVARTRAVRSHGHPATTEFPHFPVPPVDSRALAALHRAARALVDRLPELTDRLVAVLREEEPAYRAAVAKDPAGVRREVHRSLRHNVGSLLHPGRSREAARRCSAEIGAERAESGLPLDALQHAFRLGGALVWRGLVEETARSRPDDVQLLVHVAADVWNFVDEHCIVVADSYRRAERRIAWRRENRLRLAAAALLDGATRIADLPEVAEALGLPEQGRYAVALVTPPDRAPADRTGAGTPWRPDAPPGLRVLWHPGPEGDQGIVLLGDHDPGRLLRDVTVPPGVRIGIGSAVDGLAAVGDARRLAETALRCCPATGGASVLDACLPDALVVSSPVLGAALADQVLGPLRRLDPADRDVLLDTLTVWLDCDGSAQRASTRLYCHRNTVLNRLRRCEQLTGRSLARPTDLAELSLALAAHRLLGG